MDNKTTGMPTSAGSPISNLLFDFISILHAKAEGLQACEKYLQDAEQQRSQPCIDMLNRIIEQDRQTVVEVQDHLRMMFQQKDLNQGVQGRF